MKKLFAKSRELKLKFVLIHACMFLQRAKKVVFDSPGLVDFAIGASKICF